MQRGSRAQGGPRDGRQAAVAALAAASGSEHLAAAPSTDRSDSFRRPSAAKHKQRQAPAHTPDRFEREVLGGRLWHAACQAAAGGDIEQIPLSFGSLDEYICTFEPLVLEEAREGLKADWAEGCAADRAWAVEVAEVEALADGWCNLRLRAADAAKHRQLKQDCPSNTVVVLTESRPPVRGAIEWAAAQVSATSRANCGASGRAAKRQRRTPEAAQEASAPSASVDSSGAAGGRSELDATADSSAAAAAGGSNGGAACTASPAGRVVAGLVRRGRDAELVLQVHPCCAAHAHQRDAPCWAAVAALQRSAASAEPKARRWWLVPAKTLITSQREFDAVHRARAIDKGLTRFLLRPELLAPIGAYYDNPEVRRGLWPEQAAQPQFIHHLRALYDETQLEAIEMAACHLGAPDAGGAAPPGAGGKKPPTHPLLPFVLIQGPPGTGKTHTVKGMLNVWHLVAYQRYYDGLIAATAPAPGGPRRDGGGGGDGDGVHSMLTDLGRAVAQTKPRILICTPSNAACDELLGRIMADGFCDGSGRTYRPNVVRVGSERGESVNASVRDRLVTLMVDRYKNMSQADWQHRHVDLQQRHAHVARELEALEISLGRAATAARAAAAAAAKAPAGGPEHEAAAAAAQQHMELAKRVVERAQQQARLAGEMERLGTARDLVWGTAGGNPWEAERRQRDALRSIEASFLSEAEMVFTTLSSTQREVFQKSAARAPFHTVLIDEAGQASEVAALQPLVFGAKRVVLVGDPQQLPATILSELAKQVQMERSLFERLQQQGAPVKMLSVQYRMHPAIRQFPSEHFYGGRLRDADSILARPPAPFYEHPVMKPYVFFDVSKGREHRIEGGGSVSNRAEALMAACLFAELRAFLIQKARAVPGSVTGPTTVGVITPYRQQRALLRETFAEVCGKGPASEVFIETVDSFQGKQLDVVILSCVRASTGGGLGFVTDIRRMNVAITRAKRALWVLGSVGTLRANREWDALITDAEARGVVIGDADAEEMFPDLPYWQQQGQPPQRGATPAVDPQQLEQPQQPQQPQQLGAPGGAEQPPAAAAAAPAAALEPAGGPQELPQGGLLPVMPGTAPAAQLPPAAAAAAVGQPPGPRPMIRAAQQPAAPGPMQRVAGQLAPPGQAAAVRPMQRQAPPPGKYPSLPSGR